VLVEETAWWNTLRAVTLENIHTEGYNDSQVMILDR
jgi:hypothetical protein